MFQRNGKVKIPMMVISLILILSWLSEQVWLAVVAFFFFILVLLIKMPLDLREPPKDRISHFGPAHGEGFDWHKKR